MMNSRPETEYVLAGDYDALREALDVRIEHVADCGRQIDKLLVENKELRAEVEALTKDAERYRWMRDAEGSTDADIDAAMKGSGE